MTSGGKGVLGAQADSTAHRVRVVSGERCFVMNPGQGGVIRNATGLRKIVGYERIGVTPQQWQPPDCFLGMKCLRLTLSIADDERGEPLVVHREN